MYVNIKNKSYKNKTVLKDVRFYLEPGESIIVIAGSGVGKSSLVRAILDETNYDGTVEIGVKTSIGYVSQENTLDERETVYSSIFYTGKLADPYRKNSEIKKSTEKILKDLGILYLKDRRIGQLSGGQRKRVQIGQELIRETSLLICDEPDSGLDAATSNLLMSDLVKIVKKDNKKNVMVISHNINPENVNLFSKILFLAKNSSHGDGSGSIVYFGSPKNIVNYFKSILEILVERPYEEKLYNEIFGGSFSTPILPLIKLMLPVEEGGYGLGGFFADTFQRLPYEKKIRL